MRAQFNCIVYTIRSMYFVLLTLLHMHNGENSGNTSLSIVDAVIKAKIVHQSSMLLSTEHCHQSEEGRVLARERKNDGVNEKTHHWIFSRRCFAGACQAHKYNNLVFQALALLWNELPTACMHVSWPLLKVYFMYSLIGWSGQTWHLELSPPGSLAL